MNASDHPQGPFTPEALLALAEQHDAAFHDGPAATRSLNYTRARDARACAQWMKENGVSSLLYVGPFGIPPFQPGSKVLIPKGTRIRSTDPRAPREGRPCKRSHVIKVDHTLGGFYHQGGEAPVHPSIRWAGAGAYWQEADANDVELVVDEPSGV